MKAIKKVILVLLVLGLLAVACGIGVGILVRDNPEIRALSSETGIPIVPDNAEQLILADNGRLSGVPFVLLQAYPYMEKAITYGAALAAVSLLLLLLVLLIKPVMTIILLVLLAIVLYMGYQGSLGPDVRDIVVKLYGYVQSAWSYLQNFIRSNPIKLP